MKFLENEFREIELSEKFNFENARRLLLSDLITIEGKRKLKKYLSNFMGNTLQVVYTSKDYGRLTAKIKDSKPGYTCMTQCCMWNEIKAVGCRGIYTDIDIANCHPDPEGYTCRLCEHAARTKERLRQHVIDIHAEGRARSPSRGRSPSRSRSVCRILSRCTDDWGERVSAPID